MVNNSEVVVWRYLLQFRSYNYFRRYFRLSVAVAVTCQHCFRVHHGRKPQICRWNFNVVSYIAGFVGCPVVVPSLMIEMARALRSCCGLKPGTGLFVQLTFRIIYVSYLYSTLHVGIYYVKNFLTYRSKRIKPEVWMAEQVESPNSIPGYAV